MDISTLVLYSVAWLAIAIVPGPTMLLVLTNGITKNKRLIGASILGVILSDALLIIAVAIGLGALMSASEVLFSIVKWVGVAYLLWLAWGLWHAKPTALIAGKEQLSSSTPKVATPKNAFIRSITVTLSNPKGLLFFSAFLPQFIAINHALTPQYASLGVVTIFIDLMIMLAYATGGVQLASLMTQSGLRKLNRGCALFMAFLAAGLAFYKKSE